MKTDDSSIGVKRSSPDLPPEIPFANGDTAGEEESEEEESDEKDGLGDVARHFNAVAGADNAGKAIDDFKLVRSRFRKKTKANQQSA